LNEFWFDNMAHGAPTARPLFVLAAGVALCISILIPASHALISYRAMVANMDIKARLSASRVTRELVDGADPWNLQTSRMHELIAFAASDRINHRQTVSDKGGGAVFAEKTELPEPTISRSVPILVHGVRLGNITIEKSLRDFLFEFALLTVGAIVLAALSFGAFYRFPLRAFRESMERLADEKTRLASTLEKLRDSETRLITQGRELEDVQRVARLGGWSMKPNGRDLNVSRQTLEVLGITLEQAANFPAYLEDDVAPGSVGSFQLLLRQVVKTQKITEKDFRFRHPDGKVIDIQVRLWPIEVQDNWVLRVGGTLQDISESKAAERQLERLAYFDPLTGLANRTLFKRELSLEILRDEKDDGHGVLLLLDLDRFKEVNDSLGHAAGDELLTRIAQLLRQIAPDEAFIARLGGDEFAVILRGLDNHDDVETFAKQIVHAVGKPMLLGRSEVKIGASIGIVSLRTDAADADTLVKYADLALYAAKDSGRSCYAFFDRGMDELIQHKVRLARDLRRAAAENLGLEVWFQPLAALESRRAHGFEALMRWNHPELGYIPPSEFIPIAESSNLISDLGNWILRETAQTAKAWIDAGGEAYEVSVNLSPAQIWQSDLVREVAAILAETGLPPHLLCLELTESVFVDHSEGHVKQVLLSLKALGVKLALDDFGTGYSSLACLTQLPFDKLKIDRAFVQEAPLSAKGRRVLEGIVALGHGLGMTVVAEGIEQENELVILEAARCDLIQGYLIARPKPAADALIDAAKLVETLRSLSLRGDSDDVSRVA
jgi:diguanylate cyclase (GGDEF)-like protein/PAS domain S-box-containing protein